MIADDSARAYTVDDPSFDDPSLHTPQVEDPLLPFRRDPRARVLAEQGLTDKALSALRCGTVRVCTCSIHGERSREGRSCNQRFCSRCGGRLAEDKIDNHQPKLDIAKSLNLKFILCRVLFASPYELEDPEIRSWTRRCFQSFNDDWDLYIECLDLDPAIFHAVSCVGFETINEVEHLVCYALLTARDVDLVFTFRDNIWPDADDVQVTKGQGEIADMSFRQMVTIPLMDSERSAYHELIFPKGFHLLRVSKLSSEVLEDISTEEKTTMVDMSIGHIPQVEPDESDDREESPPAPKSPHCCDICGQVCTVTFEDRWDQHLKPPPMA